MVSKRRSIKVVDWNGRPTPQKGFRGAKRMCILYLVIVLLEQFNNTLYWLSCSPSGPRTPGTPGFPNNSAQSQHFRLGDHLLALEAVPNISLAVSEQHSLNSMGCQIYAQLSLPRPADRKLNIAQVWPNKPQLLF